MSDLSKRLRDFDESLSDFKAETFPSWQTGQIFNALLTLARNEFPGDPVIQAVDRVEQQATITGQIGKSASDTDVGSIRAVVKQIMVVAGQSPPAPA
ncbi:MAG: hypothetical protein ACLPYW_08225 [Acidimicrobiales bacterium]|jgi:hypothetical protein